MIVCFFIIFNNLYRASLACLSIDIYYPFAAFICFADGFFVAVQLTMLTKMAVISSGVNSVVFDVNVVVLRIAYLIQYVSSDVLNMAAELLEMLFYLLIMPLLLLMKMFNVLGAAFRQSEIECVIQ